MQTFGNFYLLSHSFEIWCDSLGEWKLATNAKFQLNFYKLMPARPKKKTTGTYAVKTTIAIIVKAKKINNMFLSSFFSSPVGSLCHTRGVVRRPSSVVRRPSYVVRRVSSVSTITTRNI